MVRYLLAGAIIVVFGALGGERASAITLVALSGDDTLTRIDAEDRTVIGVTQVQGSKRLLSIDVRSVDGKLYGLFTDGEIAIVNPATGAKSASQQLDFEFAVDVQYNIDFNAATDRLRIVGTNGDNLRANVDTGNVNRDDDIIGPESNPLDDPSLAMVAVAHANSEEGAVASQLYGIDSEPEGLYLLGLPDYGALVAVGALGRNLAEFGFDIDVNSNGRNRGRIVANGRLLDIDLGGGGVISSRALEGLVPGVNTTTRDLTTLP